MLILGARQKILKDIRALKKSNSVKKNYAFSLCTGIIKEKGKGASDMLKDNSQISLELSPYKSLYDMIIPEKHLLRRIKEHIDFSFVNPMLRKQYCEHFGRPAKEPEMMFKLMFLKKTLCLVR